VSAPTSDPAAMTGVGGPYFEDLSVGDTARSAPSLTLTAGHAAVHQSILGDRLRLPLDAGLSAQVLGAGAPLAHPGLVCDVSIGQSTVLTQRVVANLFYRGLAFRRAPVIGDTLRTTTTVTALRQNSRRPGRATTGLAALHIVTVDQEDRAVLDYWRCAMLPLRDPEAETGHRDDLDAISAALTPEVLRQTTAGWDLGALRAVAGPGAADLVAGAEWTGIGGSVVSSAPELARLSLNIATAHHDQTASATARRLVYGGHTIGIAAAHVGLALPDLATIVAWEHCDHLAPVFEGDTLFTDVTLERVEPLDDGALVHVRARVRAVREGESASSEPTDVLDWRLIAVHP
jgi:acyl dehydratase